MDVPSALDVLSSLLQSGFTVPIHVPPRLRGMHWRATVIVAGVCRQVLLFVASGSIAVVDFFYFEPLNADNLMTEVFTGVWVDPHYVAISRSGPLVGSKSTCLHCCPFTPSKAKLGRAGSAAGNVGDV